MKSIIAALIAGIAAITTNRKQVEALQAEVASRDSIIADLRAKLEAEDADDASREIALAEAIKAKDEADKRYAELSSQINEANERAAELLASVSADEEIPVSVDSNGQPTDTSEAAAK